MVALNTAYAAPKNAADPKNRVGDFFYEDHPSVGKNRWASRLNTQEKSSYHYETASGRSNWPNRDPIQEQGGVNLYGFVGNDGVNLRDYLGLSTIDDIIGLFNDIIQELADDVATQCSVCFETKSACEGCCGSVGIVASGAAFSAYVSGSALCLLNPFCHAKVKTAFANTLTEIKSIDNECRSDCSSIPEPNCCPENE